MIIAPCFTALEEDGAKLSFELSNYTEDTLDTLKGSVVKLGLSVKLPSIVLVVEIKGTVRLSFYVPYFLNPTTNVPAAIMQNRRLTLTAFDATSKQPLVQRTLELDPVFLEHLVWVAQNQLAYSSFNPTVMYEMHSEFLKTNPEPSVKAQELTMYLAS